MKQFIALTVACICVYSALAQTTPKLLPFQGRLTDQNGIAVSNGVRLVQFKIFDVPSGGSPAWAGELHRTTLNGGLVNVLLGSKTPFTGIDFDRQLYLEITVDINGDSAITAADPPMLPRQVILPVLFSKESADSRKLAGYDWSGLLDINDPAHGKLDGSKILESSIPGSKVADLGISSAKIDDSQVNARILANGSVSDRHVGILSHLTTSDGLVTNALNIDENSRVFIRNNLLIRDRNDMALYLFSSDANYGIGVQPNTTYFRTGVQFSWFRNGVHRSDQANDPGPGGESLMLLNADGNLRVQGVFQSNSDRNIKHNFQKINARDIVEKLAAIQIQTWSYTNDSHGTRHLGPVAQDFRAAFGVGSDDKHIATVDEGGVALAAIQGLHQMMKEKDLKIASLERAMEEMQKSVNLLLRESKHTKE